MPLATAISEKRSPKPKAASRSLIGADYVHPTSQLYASHPSQKYIWPADRDPLAGVVAFFIWYILWGVPLTARLYKWVRSKYFSCASPDDSTYIDLEKASDMPNESLDPYLVQSPLLDTYLRSKEEPSAPTPAYTPFDTSDDGLHAVYPSSPAVFSSSPTFDPAMSPIAHSSPPRIIVQASHSCPTTPASTSNLSELTFLQYYQSNSCSSLAPPSPALRSPSKIALSICKPQLAIW
ncbi:hypothetical protein OBBRIDRAFT_803156 [Obba rivulosa]|uniref:Uncharacterized protein n=1 Tax=Obba rivulosa TaxID=1052685 RepID=A0A8E2AYS2_9APHY|nr:hypothetical protein OBBRIDRAFT_803156 [Obba rivulosa]